MRRLFTVPVLASLASAVFPGLGARADIHSYEFAYTLDYLQPAPTEVNFQSCVASYNLYGNDGDFTSAWIAPPGRATTYPMYYVDVGYYVGLVQYPDTTSMYNDFPLGTYTISCDGGTLGAASAFVTAPDPLNLPDTIPQFDPDQFPEYQTIDSTNDYTFRFNTFDSSGTLNVIYFEIDSYPSGRRVFFHEFDAKSASGLVPAGTLKLNRHYSAIIYFLSFIEIDNGGFGTGTSVMQSCLTDTIFIKTGNCPPDFNGDGFVDIFDFNDFVTAFEDGNPDADYNGDGFADIFDFNDFVYGFETGC